MSQSKDEGKGKQRFFPGQLQTELCGSQILLVSKFFLHAEDIEQERRGHTRNSVGVDIRDASVSNYGNDS